MTIDKIFDGGQFALRDLGLYFREGLLAQEVANKFVRCAGNHASILAHEDVWPSARDEDVAGRMEHTGTTAVSVLFVIALCNCRGRGTRCLSDGF